MFNCVQSISTLWCSFISWIQQILYPNTNVQNPPLNGRADMEDALEFTGFGKFNIMLMGFALPAAVASIYDTTTMAYVITSAECDLQLSFMQKGLLNAMTHCGMISCAFLSGYITDTLGRKRTLVFGYLLDTLCNLTSIFSTNFMMLATFKFMSGFLMCGPCTVILSCLSEFFAKRYRPMIVMFVGLCFSIGSFTIPFIAWLILENPSDFVITPNFTLHSWQIFIAVCSTPSLISGLLALTLPESPRFLATMGRTDEALNVLKLVYSVNTGCPPDTFPIKEIFLKIEDSDIKHDNEMTCEVEENCKNSNVNDSEKKGCVMALRKGLRQILPLLRPPYISTLILMVFIEYGCITGCSFRLWLPQLFKMMSESSEDQNTLCEMISLGDNPDILKPIVQDSTLCEPIPIRYEMFENSIIVAAVQVFFCTLSSFTINAIGKKKLLTSTLAIAGVCCLSMYFCTSAKQATFLASITIAFGAIGSTATISALIDLFPTSLRATAASCTLMVGRIGSITGNIVFPIMLALGCLPAFLSLACVLLGCSFLSLFIPKPTQRVI